MLIRPASGTVTVTSGPENAFGKANPLTLGRKSSVRMTVGIGGLGISECRLSCIWGTLG
jgi:hypothetical protein